MQVSRNLEHIQISLFRPNKNVNIDQEVASKNFKIKTLSVPSAVMFSDKNKVLADKMISQLINVAQETNSTHANQEAQKTNSAHTNNKKYDGILKKDARRRLELMVNDPEEAKKQVSAMAVGSDFFFINFANLGIDLENPADPGWMKITEKQDAIEQQRQDITRRREAFYKSQVEKGFLLLRLWQTYSNLMRIYLTIIGVQWKLEQTQPIRTAPLNIFKHSMIIYKISLIRKVCGRCSRLHRFSLGIFPIPFQLTRHNPDTAAADERRRRGPATAGSSPAHERSGYVLYYRDHFQND